LTAISLRLLSWSTGSAPAEYVTAPRRNDVPSSVNTGFQNSTASRTSCTRPSFAIHNTVIEGILVHGIPQPPLPLPLRLGPGARHNDGSANPIPKATSLRLILVTGSAPPRLARHRADR